MQKQKIKYCSMCKKEPIKFFKVATIDKKKWYICSNDCYIRYLIEVLNVNPKYIHSQHVKSRETKPDLTNPVPLKGDAVSRIDGRGFAVNTDESDKYSGIADTSKYTKEQEEFPDY